MDRRWLLLLLVLAGLLAALRWSQTRHEPFHVSGFLEADEVRVGSRVGGRVSVVHVDEGARVAKGDVLVELEPYDLLERKAELAANVERARSLLERRRAGFRAEEIRGAVARTESLAAQLARLEAGPRPREIEAARARLEAAGAAAKLAEIEEARTRSLVEESIQSADQLDRSRAFLEAARAEQRAREEELGLLLEGNRTEDVAAARAALGEAQASRELLEHGERAEDVAIAQAELAAAEAALAALARSVDELTIHAPCDGVLEACDLEPGDLAGANQPVVVLRDTARLFVRAYVPQGRLAFDLGQVVHVSVDAWPERRFAGEVVFIAPAAEFTPSNVQTPEERSEEVLRIRVQLTEGLDVLRPGVAADVWFEG